ncbi:MAG TPA: response regulator [Candidatus Acidoferrum sp.]|jgi:diguanylate cyclase (GGDEF)-like protein|nr:response regulator [Candidatus Acidoferrum sp.]
MKDLAQGAGHRVLVVDDDRNLRKIISTNLELAGFAVETASDGAEALSTIENLQPDIVLLDLMMPYMDGYEVAKRIRNHQNPSIANVPIIILTAKGETEDKLRGFEAGADDYITKPFGPQELLARVRAKIRRVEVDSSLSPLTRLPGNLAIEAELRRRIDANEPFGVIYLDLDNFKAFNDVYGFTHGDEAIVLLARVTVDAVRRRGTANDFVGHIGGDDFIVVTHNDRAEEIAKEVIAEFDRDIRNLYSAKDLRAGFIETRDRRGALNRFPIITLSMAIVSNDRGQLSNYAQVGEAAAELKRYAKSIAGSVYVKDKRRQ